jgi:ferredoxin
MLDAAASASIREAAAEEGTEAQRGIMDAYFHESSRLACQLVLRAEDDGMRLALPDDVTNMLEVPLWMRGTR